MSFTGIWEQYNPHILHWLIVRELVQLEIIRFRAVYLTALFFLLNQMLSLRIIPFFMIFIYLYAVFRLRKFTVGINGLEFTLDAQIKYLA